MSLSKTKLGVLLPTRGLLMRESPPTSADSVLRLAEQVEAGGLDSVWVGDGLTAKPRLEPLTTLAAVAARTKRVRLGTSVLLPALRHPLLLAQTVATVDLISQGRLLLAVGVGGQFTEAQRQEWPSAGVDPARRASRLEEAVQVVKALGTGQPVTFQGRHFQLDSVVMNPRPVQPDGVPILFSCLSRARQEAQFRRAARYGDGVISVDETPEEFAQVVQKYHGLVKEMGRDPDRLQKVFYMTVNVDPDTAKAQADAEKYLRAYYGPHIRIVVAGATAWGPFGDPERVKERIAQYVEAGAQTVMFRFASFEPERQLEIFLRQVAPAFQ